MAHNYSKPIRKKLRKIAGLVHERELSSTMERLDRHFAQCVKASNEITSLVIDRAFLDGKLLYDIDQQGA